MGIVYIFQLQTKIQSANKENIKLLDGMHEGVLIISKSSQKIIFCNKPAQNLIKEFIGLNQQKRAEIKYSWEQHSA